MIHPCQAQGLVLHFSEKSSQILSGEVPLHTCYEEVCRKKKCDYGSQAGSQQNR